MLECASRSGRSDLEPTEMEGELKMWCSGFQVRRPVLAVIDGDNIVNLDMWQRERSSIIKATILLTPQWRCCSSVSHPFNGIFVALSLRCTGRDRCEVR
jgi:hypothetical protein